ncbi:hypothetical protein [Methylomonas koyamae]|uniref:hypothetical protein n=1 Tax=Methylomonas koyamae TaxID=702114 RepID=UPI000BC32D54|nr:hypothetical protein [Methylomonas koyamae]ATG89302.1 hypothetical protein MKLM6_1040 [Methylomonas koyamae]
MSNTPNAANAIRMLFDHCHETLPIDSLKWLRGLDSAAELEADNIAATLNSLANVLSADDKAATPGNDSLALILWGLASRAETVAMLIHISGEAAYLAGKKAPAVQAAETARGGEQ